MTDLLCTYVMGGCRLPVCPHGSHTLWACAAPRMDSIHRFAERGRPYHEFQPPKEPADAT